MKKYFLSTCLFYIGTVFCFSQGRLTPELLWKFGRISDAQLSPDGMTAIYNVTRYDIAANKGNPDIYSVSTDGSGNKALTATDGHEFNGRWTPDGKRIGFLYSLNDTVQLWEMNPDGTNRRQVSFITGGIESFEYSPVGKNILYTKDVKIEKTPKEIYPDLPKANVRIVDDMMYRHWNAWREYSYRHPFFSPVINGKVTDGRDIMPGESYDSPLSPYFDGDEISWSPDGKTIAYTCKKLKGKEYTISTNSDIYLYNTETGKTENMTDGMQGYDKSPVFSHDGKKIAWQSMKTAGYESDKDRLFIYDFSTKTKEDLTANFDFPVSRIQWSDDDKKIYFIAGVKATYQVYVFNFSDKKISPVTQGWHNYNSIDVSGNVIIGEKMSISMATEIFKVDGNTGKETQLTFTNKDLYAQIEMGKVEERWVRTTDGKDMQIWVIFPPKFDKSKKYPALLYCQGGPQSAISQFFSYRWNFQLMAANDYIVVAPNRRGLPTFGSEWNDEIAGDYGGQNMKDVLTGIDEFKKEPYINANRLGAVGASYGGYQVYWLAGHHEKRFKAFISHCGIYNIESKYASTDEYFFPNHDLGGPYWQKPKPKSYDFSPHLDVDKWDTPILIITGANDFRIPYTESIQAFHAAQLRGVPSKLLFFPDETHLVLKPQNSILWQREFFGWLDQWLK